MTKDKIIYGYIYLIVNNINGKTYVGKRHSAKFSDKYMGSGKHLKCAQKKYGIENFEKFLITYTYSEEDACEKEKFWIAEYRSRGKAEYNISSGGEGSDWAKGTHLSEERKKNLSNKMKGRKFSEEWILHMKENHKGFEGHQHSDVSKNKISEAEKGHRPYFCRPRTEDEKKKISEAMKGKKLNLSNEERLARSKKAKELSKKNIGRKNSEETKRKMREAAKKRWAKQRGEQ